MLGEDQREARQHKRRAARGSVMALGVKNWSRHQHFMRRRPTWIKLWHGTMNDRRFGRLPVASRALLPMVWLLASEFDFGIIDLTFDDMAHRVRWDEEDFGEAIKPCISSGFLIYGARVQDVIRKMNDKPILSEISSDPTPEMGHQGDMLENLNGSEQTIIPSNLDQSEQIRTTIDTKSDSDSNSKADLIRENLTDRYIVVPAEEPARPRTTSNAIIAAMVSAYNDAVAEFEVNWPKCTKITPKRAKLLARIAADDAGGFGGWKAALERAARSSFLNGKGKRSANHANWKADLNYFARLDVFIEIIEGKHDDESTKRNPEQGQRETSRARALAAYGRGNARRPAHAVGQEPDDVEAAGDFTDAGGNPTSRGAS
jgi:hypothetical protein